MTHRCPECKSKDTRVTFSIGLYGICNACGHSWISMGESKEYRMKEFSMYDPTSVWETPQGVFQGGPPPVYGKLVGKTSPAWPLDTTVRDLTTGRTIGRLNPLLPGFFSLPR